MELAGDSCRDDFRIREGYSHGQSILPNFNEVRYGLYVKRGRFGSELREPIAFGSVYPLGHVQSIGIFLDTQIEGLWLAERSHESLTPEMSNIVFDKFGCSMNCESILLTLSFIVFL